VLNVSQSGHLEFSKWWFWTDYLHAI